MGCREGTLISDTHTHNETQWLWICIMSLFPFTELTRGRYTPLKCWPMFTRRDNIIVLRTFCSPAFIPDPLLWNWTEPDVLLIIHKRGPTVKTPTMVLNLQGCRDGQKGITFLQLNTFNLPHHRHNSLLFVQWIQNSVTSSSSRRSKDVL